ncbi:hypothetical protein GOBAR_DD04647 [Gossypium barbadense]|nr:hypothetical protein GOBAR_DD04647 [Gossypium barbadense]
MLRTSGFSGKAVARRVTSASSSLNIGIYRVVELSPPPPPKSGQTITMVAPAPSPSTMLVMVPSSSRREPGPYP